MSTMLNASGAATYSWVPATGLDSTSGASVTANPSINTTYLVTGTDSSGCIDTASFALTVNSIPLADAGNAVSINAGDSVMLNGSGGNLYVWSPDTSLSNAFIANPYASPSTTCEARSSARQS